MVEPAALVEQRQKLPVCHERDQKKCVLRHGILLIGKRSLPCHPDKGGIYQKVTDKKKLTTRIFSGEGETDCRFDVVTVLAECEGENLITSFVIEHYIDAFWADY